MCKSPTKVNCGIEVAYKLIKSLLFSRHEKMQIKLLFFWFYNQDVNLFLIILNPVVCHIDMNKLYGQNQNRQWRNCVLYSHSTKKIWIHLQNLNNMIRERAFLWVNFYFFIQRSADQLGWLPRPHLNSWIIGSDLLWFEMQSIAEHIFCYLA